MKIILFALFSVLGSQLYSQGNLQFNQVLTYTQSFTSTYVGIGSYSYTGPSYTVPANKVWKIEKFSMNGGPSGSSLLVNNIHGVGQGDVNLGPIWLKPGDIIKATSGCSNCGSFPGSYFISIIEFNVIP